MARTLALLLLILFLDYGLSAPLFPAVFFFGDSMLDTGNNDYIATVVRSNFAPYGEDFPGHSASGRFSNGRLVSDLLSAELGLKDYSPPFLDPRLSDDDLRTGVNFASAGSGFDEATSLLTNTLPISGQLELFKSYVARLKGVVGQEEASRVISNALILISSGNNDMGLNTYIPKGERYQYFLQQKLQSFLRSMYGLGARKFGVFGLLPEGCVPAQITVARPLNRGCIKNQNQDSVAYNSKLQTLLPRIQQSLAGSKLAYISWYDPLLDMATNPNKYGFQETTRGCCGTGLFETGPTCNIESPQCPNRSSFLFFDAIHPSESAYRVITKQIMDQVIPKLE